MKNLKYLLFSILLSLSFINYVNAEEVCVFGDELYKFTCKLNNNEVTCQSSGANKSTILKDYSNVKAEDVIVCKSAIMVPSYENGKNYIQLYGGVSSVPENLGDITIEIPGKKVDATGDAEKLAQHNGKSCSYNLGVLNYTCVIENGKPNCTLKYTEAPLSYALNMNNITNVLTANDFLNGNNFVCPTDTSNKLHICGEKMGDKFNVSYVGKSCQSLSDYGVLTYSSSSSGSGTQNPGNSGGNNGSQNSGSPGGNNGTQNPGNSSGNNSNENDPNGNGTIYNPQSFCEKENTKGAFRVLGWAIYIIKIVIPILLIVLGSIDVGKAVVASKDDEIKKSIKTLAIRVVTGIIVFFIPSILDFIVGGINGDDIYNSNEGFGKCTHCMLDPTDDRCGSLMGGH